MRLKVAGKGKAMKNKRNPTKPKAPPTVNWVHRPDLEAEATFWQLYFRLSLEAMIKEPSRQEKPR
jgi:hypothetical protein